MDCIYSGSRREEPEEALTNEPISIYRQEVGGEDRFVYYGETDAGRLMAVIVTERGEASSGDRLRFGCGASARLYWEAIPRRLNGEKNDGDTEI
jgi:hypothetical protein